jgi:hypothetical protein
MSPILPFWACIFFAIHVIFLNLIQVAVTEPHWLRMWAFQTKELRLQVASTSATAVLWMLLMAVGFLTYRITNGKVAELAIADLLRRLLSYSSLFIVAFWSAGVAALFASSDTLIYSFLLVYDFNPKDGHLRSQVVAKLHPLVTAAAATAVFALVYVTVDAFKLPFEKVMFVLIPFCLNAFPAFALAAAGRRPRPNLTIFSLVVYVIIAIYGFLTPENELLATLAASFVPVATAAYGVLASRTERVEQDGKTTA